MLFDNIRGNTPPKNPAFPVVSGGQQRILLNPVARHQTGTVANSRPIVSPFLEVSGASGLDRVAGGLVSAFEVCWYFVPQGPSGILDHH